MNKYFLPLLSDKFYHIYNHSVGKLNIFENDGNYIYFLEKYKEYLSPFVDTFAYCLMPNHFHFAIRIKDLKQLPEIKDKAPLTKFQTLSKVNVVENVEKLLSKQFSIFFSSYSQAFNKQQKRRGALFERPFKRKLITSDEYFKNLIYYIHLNPVHHKFVEDFQDWKFTSYNSYFSNSVSLLKDDEITNFFNDKNEFADFHNRKLEDKLLIEFE